MRFDPANYESVDERLGKFWDEHPAGRIETFLLSNPDALDECVFRANVFFDINEPAARGVGHASEKRGGQGANLTCHLENAETSAIGRALANAGYKTKRDAQRPSREEMQKQDRQSAAARPAPAAAPVARPAASSVSAPRPAAPRAEKEPMTVTKAESTLRDLMLKKHFQPAEIDLALSFLHREDLTDTQKLELAKAEYADVKDGHVLPGQYAAAHEQNTKAHTAGSAE